MAREDARIPFPDPYRSTLVAAADGLTRVLKQQGGRCLEARFLRVPVQDAEAVLPAYREQLEGTWTPASFAAPPFRSGLAFRQEERMFAVAVADRAEGDWTGVVIVTNSFWDAASHDALVRCLAETGG